jgi:hypothetical protein
MKWQNAWQSGQHDKKEPLHRCAMGPNTILIEKSHGKGGIIEASITGQPVSILNSFLQITIKIGGAMSEKAPALAHDGSKLQGG